MCCVFEIEKLFELVVWFCMGFLLKFFDDDFVVILGVEGLKN